MQKFLLAAVFAVVCAGTAFADAFTNPFYVAIDRASGRCVMMQFMGAGGPNTHRYKIMGTYGSMKSAHKAMTHMAGCH
jgi:opacity protein-like surface antigen